MGVIVPRTNMTAPDWMPSIGNNTGNMFFIKSMIRHVGADNIEENIENIQDCRVVALSLANIIRENYIPYGPFIDFLEKYQLPCCVAGIGAQATIGASAKLTLRPELVRLLRILAERAVSLGVRGEYTAECLASIGIYNTKIIGCPSIFYNQWQQPVIQKKATEQLQCVFSAVSHALKSGSPLILQTYYPLINVSLNVPLRSDWVACKKYFKELNIEGDDVYLYDIARKSLRVFYDVNEWIHFLSKYDFVCGTRIHGCVAGILAGVPSMVLTIDSRTKELAETLNIPSMDGNAFDPKRCAEYYDSIDTAAFNKNYAMLYGNFLEFLRENQIDVSQ